MKASDALSHYTGLAEDTFGNPPPWLQERRAAALAGLTARGFPTRKQEAWRYTSLDTLLSQPFALAREPVYRISASGLSAVQFTTQAAARLVFCDGHFIEPLSDTAGLPSGVKVSSLRHMLSTQPHRVADRLGRLCEADSQAFEHINTALAEDGLWLEIAAGVSLENPIEVIHTSQQRATASLLAPRNLVIMHAGARATLVEHYTSAPGSNDFTNSVTEIALDANAQLNHYRLQNEGLHTFHKSTLAVQQQADSSYQGIAVSLGASWSRTDYRVRFDGEAAACRLNGLYITGEQQLCDFHVDIDHAVPACHSDEHFKGILAGKSRAVFDGRVRVAPGARKTEAHLKNDNLLLSRDAEVDTKPQLEIFADEVQCSHGTTVGQIEDQQLFYLRSRGIDETTARRLLCNGFAREVLADCPVPGFIDYVAGAIEARL